MFGKEVRYRGRQKLENNKVTNKTEREARENQEAQRELGCNFEDTTKTTEKKPRIHLNKSVTIRTYAGGGHIPSLIINNVEKSFSLETFRDFIRKVDPIECERLQTLPDNYTEGVSNTQRYKMIGNGWNADTIAHIYSFLPLEWHTSGIMVENC